MTFYMRLSNTQKFLIHFFLITSLTLLLKPNANAQTVQPNNVFAYNDYRHNNSEDDHIYIGADMSKHDEGPAEAELLPTMNFHRILENFYLKSLAYHTIRNNSKAYQLHNITLIRTYSIDLKQTAHLTFKVFELVIVPLWQSK
jgi:hypothetical protein